MKNITEKRFLKIAESILSCPTAAYCEQYVIGAVKTFVQKHGPTIKLKKDCHGNLLLSYRGKRGRKLGSELVLQAHMDHPGLLFDSQKSDRVFSFKKTGGYGNDFAKDARVRIYASDTNAQANGILGRVTQTTTDKKGETFFEVTVRSAKSAQAIGEGSFAMWDLVPFSLKKRIIHGRACDDLGGVSVALAYLDELVRQKAKITTHVLLTRAEEVGFAGLLGSIDAGFPDRNAFYINIECSSVKAGAVQGAGPIIRVGDASSIFDPGITAGLVTQATELKKQKKNFAFQRKLMDSGSCEATVLTQAGYRTGAVALPLGNYHNMAENSQFKAESIHINDALNLVDLLLNIANDEQGIDAAIQRGAEKTQARLGNIQKELVPLLSRYPIK